MAKKGFLKNDNEIMLPITRGELVLDSSGQLAFHSGQFLADENCHGLMSKDDKININNIIEKTNDLDTNALNSAINSIKNAYLKSVDVNNTILTITDQSDHKTNFYNTIYTFESGTDGSFTVKENGTNSQIIKVGTLTDEKVGQKNTTDNKEYRILLSNSDNDNDEVAPSNKSEKLLFNPSTGILTAKSFIGEKFDGKVHWNNIDNKPETFKPETHNHSASEIFIPNNYQISEKSESISSQDALTDALSKLEYKANLGEDAWDWINLTMSDTDDDNTNIDRLKEIFDILKNINETDVIPSIIGNYLPLTGGTITGTLTINRNASAIHYNNASGTSWGWMGFSNKDIPTVWMHDGTTSYSLYHSGNLKSLPNPHAIKFININGEEKSYDGSSELDLTGGINYAVSTNKLNNLYTVSTRPTSLNPEITGDGSVIHFLSTSSAKTGYKADGHILHFNWDTTVGLDSQLLISNGGTLYTRGMNSGTWNEWRTILDTTNYSAFTLPIKTITESKDASALTDSGIYKIQTTDMTNMPTKNWGILNSINNSNYLIQQFYPDNGADLYIRRVGISNSNLTTNWTRVVTNRNYTKIIGNPFKVNAQSYNTAADGSVSTGDIYLEMWRGDLASWKLINTGGTFKFLCNYTDTKGNYYDALTIGYNTGNIHTRGKIQINATSSYNDEKTLPDHAKLIIGNVTDGGTYGLYFSRNSILHMTNNKAVGNPLLINPLGGLVKIGSGGLESSGNILPASTNAYTLGNTSIVWANVYTSQINLKSGYDRKIILNNTDADNKYQLISFQQNGTEYGYLGTTSSDALVWTGNTVWHAGNDGTGSGLDADLLDGTHKSGLLTALTSSVDTNLSITVGGTTKSVTSLYSTYTKRFRQITNVQDFDLNTGLVGGALISNYTRYSYNLWKNAPSDMQYGTVVEFSNGGYTSLSGQLAWDINHNSTTNTTKDLYWRAADTNGFGYSLWSKIITDQNFESFVSSKYLPLSGGTMTGTINSQSITPKTSNSYTLGSSSYKWSNVHATTFTGGSIELSASTPYIDFHYNSSTLNYTSRIIEYADYLYIEKKPVRHASLYTYAALSSSNNSSDAPIFAIDCSSVKDYTFLTIAITLNSTYTGTYGHGITVQLINLHISASYIIRLTVKLYNSNKTYWNSSDAQTVTICNNKGSSDKLTYTIPITRTFSSNTMSVGSGCYWMIPTNSGLAVLATLS